MLLVRLASRAAPARCHCAICRLVGRRMRCAKGSLDLAALGSTEPRSGALPAKPLIEQLKVGARLVMPLGPAHALRS